MVENIWEGYVTSEEAAQAAATADLIPSGTYEGTLLTATSDLNDQGDSPLYGKPVARCRIEVYEVAGKTRTLFFSATSADVRDAQGKLFSATKLGHQLAKATGTLGKPFDQTLQAAQETRLRYRVGQLAERDGYEARNAVFAISAVR